MATPGRLKERSSELNVEWPEDFLTCHHGLFVIVTAVLHASHRVDWRVNEVSS